MIQAWKELASYTEQNMHRYVRNHPLIIVIIIALSIISIVLGYLLGGLVGLRIGIIVAILNWWLTPYARQTIVEIRSSADKEKNTN